MIKSYIIFLLLIFLTGCSTDNKTSIWSKKKIETQKNQIVLFNNKNILKYEINSKIKIKLKESYQKVGYSSKIQNNFKIQNYSGSLQEVSKFKFPKIKNFNSKSTEILISDDKSIVYFDGKGNIFKIDNNLNLLWKRNIYTKKERKQNLLLNFAQIKNKLIVTDNLSYYYLINFRTGDLLWKRKNSSAFNSQIKADENNFYTADFENILKCFSIKNGEELWSYKSENTLIKTTKNISIVLSKNKVVYLDAVGDVNAVDKNSGDLLWQSPTLETNFIEDSFSLISSDLVLDNNFLYFSNNKNKFFKININNGSVIWKISINSTVKPVVIDKIIFSITTNGFLAVIDNNTGKILRFTDFKKNTDWNIKLKNNGFMIGKNKIYLLRNSGHLYTINILDGKVTHVKRLQRENIAGPFIYGKFMYVISENKIIKLN